MSGNSEFPKRISLGILGTLIGLVVGIISGYFIARDDLGFYSHQKSIFRLFSTDNWNDNPHLSKYIIENIQPDNIRENLRECSREPHVAGSPRDEELAAYIKNKWLEYGFDTAELVPYNVLLSRTNPKKLNKVEILGPSEEVLMSIVPLEQPLLDEDHSQTQTQAFHAYSPNGIVEGEVIYANNGDSLDFHKLAQNNISLAGKIMLIKQNYFSSETATEAHLQGIVGILTFVDPEVYPGVLNPKNQYPNSVGLPSSGMVSSALTSGGFGDMQTPGFPSTDDAYRIPQNTLGLSPIPSQPISYDDAMKIINLLKSGDMPDDWNITETRINIGPGFQNPGFRKLRLSVFNEIKPTKIYNVIGTIKGNVEPDRYIILGNHRDAWSYGGVDPCSGTATMLELSRIFGEMMKSGWRPRRSLIFGSWTAEEFGLIGSTEWVEEKLPKLRERAVTYINTDICVIGENFFPLATPLLHEALLHVTKMISDPKGEENTFFEAWLKQSKKFQQEKGRNPEEILEPIIDPYGMVATDHIPFRSKALIPVMDINWRPKEFPSYPVYHTGYDTFNYMIKFVDPDFKFHKTCGQVAGLLLHYLADAKILPFSIKRNMKDLMATSSIINRVMNSSIPEEAALKERINRTLENYEKTVEMWYQELQETDRDNPFVVRRINDQMMAVENIFTFIDPTKSELRFPVGRREIFHLIYDIIRVIYRARDEDQEEEEKEKKFNIVKEKLSYLILFINYIIQILQPVSKV